MAYPFTSSQIELEKSYISILYGNQIYRYDLVYILLIHLNFGKQTKTELVHCWWEIGDFCFTNDWHS